MKITQVKLGRISTPLRVPFKTALRTVSSVEDVIVEPLAVFDFRVGGVRPEDEGKHRLETAVHHIDEQPVGVDVFFQHLLRRIAVAPLGRVARIRHCFPGMGIDL